MKTSLCFSLLLVAAPVVAQTTPTTPVVPAKFDWKMRLTKGQTWTQTLKSTVRTRDNAVDPTTKRPSLFRTDASQTIGLKYEVVSETAGAYMVRTTYTKFEQNSTMQSGGRTLKQPTPPGLSKAFVGASFSLTMTPDGRVSKVIGLEDLVARENKYFETLVKTKAERDDLKRILPTAKALRESIIKTQSVALPQTPLAVGDSYSYTVSLPASFAVPVSANAKRTLRALTDDSATFDESGTFSVAPSKPVLSGGRRTYIAMQGKVSGVTVVDARSGIMLSTHASIQIGGRVTVIDAKGTRVTAPIEATSETTLETSTAPVLGVPR